jgi:hypothetical protein
MREWLEWQLQRRAPGCELLFHYKGKPLGSHLKGWARGCCAAGLNGLKPHDLRSAIRNMERAGIPTEKLEQYKRTQQQPKLKRVK